METARRGEARKPLPCRLPVSPSPRLHLNPCLRPDQSCASPHNPRQSILKYPLTIKYQFVIIYLMSPNPPKLADQLAGLRAMTQQTPHTGTPHFGTLPAALHRIIMAILQHLFTRLEQVFLLWQSDQLPPPQSTPQSTPGAPQQTTPREPAAPRPRRAPRTRTPVLRPGPRAIPRPTRQRPIAPHAIQPRPIPKSPHHPARRPRPARDPPTSPAPIRRQNPPSGGSAHARP